MIGYGEHTFVAGRTGSGKTFLTKRYLRDVNLPLFVIDLKKTLYIGKAAYVSSLSKIKQLSKKENKIVYQPDWEEMDFECYNEFFKICYQRGECIVWIDELMGVGSEIKFPDYYKAIMTRGRELGISVWNVTQRPKRIPLIAMSEATHYFIFDLNMLDDRKRISEISGRDEFIKRPGKYVFWYYNAQLDSKPVRGKLVKEEKNG